MSAAAGAGATPLICVPEDAKEAPRGALKAVIDYMVQYRLERNRMEQAYMAHLKVLETVAKHTLREYVTTHMDIHDELEKTSGKRYGALEPATITSGYLGRNGWVTRSIGTLPTKGKIWYIHYGVFVPPSAPYGGWGSLPPDTTVAWAIDNYGNLDNLSEHSCSKWHMLKIQRLSMVSPSHTWTQDDAWTPGDSNHLYPLTKKQIDIVKTLPTEGPSCEHMRELLPTLLKGWAEETFHLRIAERRRYEERLEEELCASRTSSTSSSPTEDLLGITDADAPAPVRSTSVFDIIKNTSLLDI